MSDQPNLSVGAEGEIRRGGKKRKSKKKKQRKPINDIDFGDGITAADAAKVKMDVDGEDKEQHNDVVTPDNGRKSDENNQQSDDDGSPETKRVIHSVETGENGDVIEVTETTTIKREGGHAGDGESGEMKVDDLAEGENTLLVDVQQEGNVHTETTTELDSGPVTVENYEEKLDDNTTVQVVHTSQTLTTTKTVVITEDGQEVEVDPNDPNVEYIEEEPEIITEEVTQVIRRRRVVTKTADGREIETFEDVVVSDEDGAVDEETTTTVVVTHDDAPEEGNAIPACHVTIGTLPGGQPDEEEDEEPTHINRDEGREPVTVIEQEPSNVEEEISMQVESHVESQVDIDDLLGPNDETKHQLSFTHVEKEDDKSDDEPAVVVEMPAHDDDDKQHSDEVTVAMAANGDDNDDRPRSESQHSATFLVPVPKRDQGSPAVPSKVRIYIRAEEPTPEVDDDNNDAKVHVRPAPPTPVPGKEELIEKQSFGARDGIDEWVLVNFKQNEVLEFIELLKTLPFSYDLSTEVPQQQCSCW